MKIAQAYLEENNTLNLSEINLAHSLPFIIPQVIMFCVYWTFVCTFAFLLKIYPLPALLQFLQQLYLFKHANYFPTRLELSYSVLCRDNLIGPGCDLLCNSSAANSGTAVCQSQRTGYFNLCRWTNGKAQA